MNAVTKLSFFGALLLFGCSKTFIGVDGVEDLATPPDLRVPADLLAADLSGPAADLRSSGDLPGAPDLSPALPRITFLVDTTKMADGKNQLAKVLPGEKVFLAGAFSAAYPMWDPQNPKMAMTDEGGGIFSIVLSLPAGSMLQYKFAKTEDAMDGWSNGEKAFHDNLGATGCTNFPGQTSGLFEIMNRTYTVPAMDSTVGPIVIDAFRDYAETFGYKTCA
jgi:hypothetical protein